MRLRTPRRAIDPTHPATVEDWQLIVRKLMAIVAVDLGTKPTRH